VEALERPDKREFLNALVKMAGEIHSQEFIALLPLILPYFDVDDQDNAQAILVEAIAYFSGRSHHIVGPLVDARFYFKMPIAKRTAEHAVALISAIATHAPESFTPEYGEPVARIAAIAPASALALLDHCGQLLPLPVALELHLEVAERAFAALSESPASTVLVQKLAEFSAKQTGVDPRAGRLAALYLTSPHEETVIAAYRCVTALCDPLPQIPESAIAAHLASDALRPVAYEYLARLPAIEPSAVFVSALAARPNDTEAWRLLGKVARTDAAVLLVNTEWLETENVREALRLLVVMATEPALRKQIAALPQYAAILKAGADIGEDAVLSDLALIVGRCEISEGILRRLAAEGFWRAFVDAAKKSFAIDVQQNCILLLMNFCGTGWVEEFAEYVKFALGMLAAPELANGVVQMLLRLSFTKEGVDVINDLQMIEYLERLQENEFYLAAAEGILKNVRGAR
jgi:hypothetical protein